MRLAKVSGESNTNRSEEGKKRILHASESGGGIGKAKSLCRGNGGAGKAEVPCVKGLTMGTGVQRRRGDFRLLFLVR